MKPLGQSFNGFQSYAAYASLFLVLFPHFSLSLTKSHHSNFSETITLKRYNHTSGIANPNIFLPKYAILG